MEKIMLKTKPKIEEFTALHFTRKNDEEIINYLSEYGTAKYTENGLGIYYCENPEKCDDVNNVWKTWVKLGDYIRLDRTGRPVQIINSFELNNLFQEVKPEIDLTQQFLQTIKSSEKFKKDCILLLNNIPFGFDNKITNHQLRSVTGFDRRQIRLLMAFINWQTETPIIGLSSKGGYFRPTIDDITYVKRMINENNHRARMCIRRNGALYKFLRLNNLR